MSNRPIAPLFATVNVTGHCNLACTYCFFQPRAHAPMRWEDFERVIDALAQLEVFFINLSGGEPFTHPEIDRFLRLAHAKFRHVVVLTNGTILDARHIETISEIVRTKGGFPIQISIDSIAPKVNRHTRGEVDKVLNNIQLLSRLGADLVIAMVISRFNLHTVFDSIVELARYTTHFHLMTVQPVRALNKADHAYQPDEDELARLWTALAALKKSHGLHIATPADNGDPVKGCAYGAPCMAGFSHLVIDPTLKVRPCDRCVQTFVGDLNQETLSEVWRGQALQQVLASPIPFCQRADQELGVLTG